MGSVVRAITKPISKVLDKVIPNEIKPVLPYAAALFPFLAPGAFGAMAGGLGSFGISNPLIQRGLLSGGLNLVSQASQEGAAQRGINPLSILLAAGTGALSGAGATESLQGAQTVGTSSAGNISAADLASKYPGLDSAATAGNISAADFASRYPGLDSATQIGYSTDLSFLDQAKNLGLEGLSKISPSLEQGAKADLFSLDKLKAVAAPVGFAATEQAYNAALDAQSKYDKELSAYNTMTGQISADSMARRIKAITESMTNAGFGTSDIESALRQIGLLAVGGRVGAMNGGIMDVRRGLVEIPGGYSGNRYKQLLQLLEEARASQDIDKIKEVESDLFREYNKKKEGGLMGLKMGGMPIEMDYRMGGFIPVGSKERADDVPARLSKNEFVMTADAVRAAGGGSVNEGARRMYQLMNQLEGKLA
jgi:hypothetical protein